MYNQQVCIPNDNSFAFVVLKFYWAQVQNLLVDQDIVPMANNVQYININIT